MVDDEFRKRYQHEPMLHSVVTRLCGILDRAEMTPHDLARCVVLAAEIHAHRASGPIAIVLRPTGGPREYVLTEEEIERLIARTTGGIGS